MSQELIAQRIGRPVEVVPAKEYGQIDVDPARVLTADGRLRIEPHVLDKYVRADFAKDGLRLHALGVTGLIPLTRDLAVQVSPRFPVSNLTHMVARCGYSPTPIQALRAYRSADAWADWTRDVMTDALLTAVESIVQLGLLRTYIRREGSSSSPHGRLEATKTALRFASRGVNHVAVHSWFERTADNPPNRLLRETLLAAHRHYYRATSSEGVRGRRRRIAVALGHFAEVSPDPHLKCLSDRTVRGIGQLPEARAYYRGALDIAISLTMERGLDLDAAVAIDESRGTPQVAPGHVLLDSLVIKTDELFESYVRLSLATELGESGHVRVVDGNQREGSLPLYEPMRDGDSESLPEHVSLDTGKDRRNANPDIVFRAPNGRDVIVADVKYTRVTDFAERSELEQVVLYGARYNAPAVMTIHPRRSGVAGGLHVAGRIGNMLVLQYRVDLGASDLEQEMRQMAAAVDAVAAGLGA